MFKLASEFSPAGGQPAAISELLEGFAKGKKYQTLQGITGSGKTFTLANVLAKLGRPVLVLSHNKTLAAQLYSEFKTFFPDNAVEYFISYYDYYLPESYIPQTDTYIAKDASINENIEKLRLSATASLLERKDVIVIASVSCIYGLGSPEDYEFMCVGIKVGDELERDELLRRLVAIQYERNDIAPNQGQFRVRGDLVDVFSPQKDEFTRIQFWGSEVEAISVHDTLTGNRLRIKDKAVMFPCKHFVMPPERIESASENILREMRERVQYFESEGKLVEAQRLYQRVRYDMEMLREIGYCSGVENYSLHLSGRNPGSRPYCLLDFFPNDFITLIDESHVTLPQVGAMYRADRSRKQTLVDHGFRLPSALDNRPLMFDEFEQLTGDTIYVSATPGNFELEKSGDPVELVIRPTGLLDPSIVIRPLDGQVDDVIAEVRDATQRNERVIITTLTKKNSERLADYMQELDIKAKYLHSELDALERVRILSELRRGDFDCLIGINLLREGIDLPEVALIAILDADKEGFLRSERALIQIAGRAARNVNGRVILYADKKTDSIKKLLEITEHRRAAQLKFNQEHNIIPRTISKKQLPTISDVVCPEPHAPGRSKEKTYAVAEERGGYSTGDTASIPESDMEELLRELETEMFEAAAALEFERAADLRDKIKKLSENMDFKI
jgi:excinuclease ABC subunit B